MDFPFLKFLYFMWVKIQVGACPVTARPVVRGCSSIDAWSDERGYIQAGCRDYSLTHSCNVNGEANYLISSTTSWILNNLCLLVIPQLVHQWQE